MLLITKNKSPQKAAACQDVHNTDVKTLPVHLAALYCKKKKKVKSIGPLLYHALTLTHAIMLHNPCLRGLKGCNVKTSEKKKSELPVSPF